jgi:WD40 repeat protein
MGCGDSKSIENPEKGINLQEDQDENKEEIIEDDNANNRIRFLKKKFDENEKYNDNNINSLFKYLIASSFFKSDYSIKIFTVTQINFHSTKSTEKLKNPDIYGHFSLNEHTDTILCICYLKENLIASGSADNTIKIWNILDQTCEQTLSGHNGYVDQIIKLKNENFLASKSFIDQILIWDYTKGKIISKLVNSSTALNMFELNENKIASSIGNKICLWSINNGKLHKEITFNEYVIRLQKLNYYDSIVAVIQKHNKIDIVDMHTFKIIKQLSGHIGKINTLESIDYYQIATGSEDCCIKLWEVNNKSTAPMKILRLINEEFNAVKVITKITDTSFAAGYAKGNVRIWELPSGIVSKEIDFLTTTNKTAVYNLIYLKVSPFLENNMIVFSYKTSRDIILWKYFEDEFTIIREHKGEIRSLIFT